MLIFLAVLLTIILVISFFLFKPLEGVVKYSEGIFTVKLGWIVLYSSKKQKEDKEYYKVPKLKFNDLIVKYNNAKDLFEDEKHEVVSILQEMNRRLGFRMFNISITFGFGDAAVTGIANGFIWAGITGIVSILKRYIDIENLTNIAISPNYTESCFSTDVSLIFRARIIRIIGIYSRIKKLIERNESKFKRII